MEGNGIMGVGTLFRFEDAPVTTPRARSEVQTGLRRTPVVLLLVLILTSVVGPRASVAQVIDPNWAPPRTVYIPATGHSIDGYFLDLWRASGGAGAFGNPITPEITLDNGHIVQYYEYARFEYWPEGDQFGNYVLLGRIGAELRPVSVRRETPGPQIVSKDRRVSTGQAFAATLELRAMTRAWLPLPANVATQDSPTRRYVPETAHTVSNGFKAFWEATGEAAYLGNPLTEEYTVSGTTYQVFERGQLAWKDGNAPYMVPVGVELANKYGLDTAPVAQGALPTYSEDLWIPPVIKPGSPPVGPMPGAPKTIVVSISEQAMWAFEGSEVVLESYVSTGKERFDTPTGTFYVNTKVPVQDMEGVIGGEYYNVPKVPDVMYFTDRGHAIHGAYWHENFGTPMSHGCINLPMDVADWMYDWAPLGMAVVIVE
jgi:lipoprotein-anchoring transpeptidase ErfK/SrfK